MNLPEWLHQPFAGESHLPLADAAVRLLVALVLGLLISAIYRAIRGPRATHSSLLATLVLLTVLIAMTTIVIGDNVARAFSIVGALSIVRFRTVVEDTRDTAFVIFAVGVGMAIGAGYLAVPLISLPIAFGAAYIFRRYFETPSPRNVAGLPCLLEVRIAPDFAEAARMQSAIASHATVVRLSAIGSARAGAAVEESYELAIPDEHAMRALASELRQIPGVQEVDLGPLAR